MAARIKEEEAPVFLHKLVCQLCDYIFEENTPIACVHLSYCRKCLEIYGLHKNDLGRNMVCARCSTNGESVRSDHSFDKCPSHKHEDVDLSCKGCKVDICHKCVLVDHRGHIIENRKEPDSKLQAHKLQSENKQDKLNLMNLVARRKQGFLQDCDTIVRNLLSSPRQHDRLNTTSDDGPEQSSVRAGATRSSEVPDSSQPSTSAEQTQSVRSSVREAANFPDVQDDPTPPTSKSIRSDSSEDDVSPSPTDSLSDNNEPGTTACNGAGCQTCILVKNDSSSVTGPSGETVNVTDNFTCKSERVIYYIECQKCKIPYVGKTKGMLNKRMSEHCRDIKKKILTSSVAEHFNLPEHDYKRDFRVCVLIAFHGKTSNKTLLKKEKELMLRLGTIEYGMNKS